MNIASFNTLKKIMEQTFTDNDHECLAAIRAANKVLLAESLTWTRILSKTINVIAEVEGEIVHDAPVHRRPSDDEDLIREAEDNARKDSAMEFVASVRNYYERKGFITDGQRVALRKMT